MSGKLRHVAIIMDGNGRWAQRRGLPRSAGHRAGSEKIEEILRMAQKLDIEYLTLYAFSTENWKRPVSEVSALMGLLTEFLAEKEPFLMREGVRLLTIGRTDGLPKAQRQKLLEVIAKTAENKNGNLVLALNYGGRAEIVDAAKKLLEQQSDLDKLDENSFARCLYLPELPEVDLLIRTGGEFRISNFLLWQAAYAEILVSELLWPEFSAEEFVRATQEFNRRDRRFGGTQSTSNGNAK